MDAALAQAVSDFCLANPSLATASGSFSKCGAVSLKLKSFLEKRGYEAEVLRLAECSRQYPGADRRWRKLGGEFWWVHYAVRVEDVVVDCAARQFDSECEHPLIRSLQDVTAEWGEAYGVDPVTGARNGPRAPAP